MADKRENAGLGYRGKLDRFNASMCDIKDAHPLPSQLVQISASEDEIKRRIQCFVEKKRDEIDLCNIMDFTQVTVQSKINTDKSNMTTQDMESAGNENEYMTCARVNSTIVKQEYSKGHLRVKRVENDVGPQMRPDYLNTLDKLMTPAEKVYESNTVVKKEFKRRHSKEDSTIAKYPAIIERLQAIEEHINVPQLRKQDIYQRLKVIEDRILYLESISPEYRHFLAEKPLVRDSSNVFETYNDIVPTTGLLPYERKIYSASEIDTIIQSFDGRDTEQNFKSDKSL